MKILVTGGAGYIGSVLVPHLLQQGHLVSVLDNLRFGGAGLLSVYEHPHFTLYKGDIGDEVLVREAMRGKDAVVHLAAFVGEPQCSRNPDEAWRVNYKETLVLAKLAKKLQVPHFVFASTCSNYGVTGPGDFATEGSNLNPLALYAETKVKAEQALAGNETVAILRLATVYGLSPRMRFDLLINEFARDAVTGWLLVYGADSWRPFVHVQDVARFISLTLTNHLTGVFNVGGHNRKKAALVEALKHVCPDLQVEFKEGKIDLRNYRVSFDKAKLVGFTPEFTPESGLQNVAVAVQEGFFTDSHSNQYRNA